MAVFSLCFGDNRIGFFCCYATRERERHGSQIQEWDARESEKRARRGALSSQKFMTGFGTSRLSKGCGPLHVLLHVHKVRSLLSMISTTERCNTVAHFCLGVGKMENGAAAFHFDRVRR